ncbi:MAG: TIM-barrel domain-containing protein [Chitinophagaceae bacterium]
MKKIYLVIQLLMIGQFIKAQITQQGFKVQSFPHQITKVTFTPNGYTRNENFTQATILKPQVINTHHFTVKDSTITLLRNNFSFSAFHNGDYYGFKFPLQPDEAIYGGGERATAMNRRGQDFMLYNNPRYGYNYGERNLNFSVPIFFSNKGYALFFDNGSKGYANIGNANPNSMEFAFMSGELNVYIITGKSYQEILTNLHHLTGKQPLPPLWAMGNFMSRFGYTSEKQVNEISAKMDEQKIPYDGLIFDLFWFGNTIQFTLGNLDWINKEAWPNPKAMIEKYSKKNIHTTLITEPFFLENTKTYEESKPFLATDADGKPFQLQDFYFGKGGLLDIFRKDAGNWIWNKHYKKQIFENNVKAWWTDLGEPEGHSPNMLHNFNDVGAKRKLGGDEVHNIYGQYWNKMLFDKYSQYLPNERLFHLNRSGFAGSQRFSIFPWSGDVERSWAGLKAQLPIMQSMSICGIPYIHADAGGFAMGQKDAQLYVRWLQFATYTPVFRPHGTALFEKDTNATSFASEPALMDTPYRYYAKQAVIDRYKLLPYNYTLTYRHTQFAEPLVRPLFFDFGDDVNAVNAEHQYLWGPNILVAPVLEKNATTQQVYLPKASWYNPVENKLFTGQQNINVDVQQYKFPVFYKAGSFIPKYNCNGENTASIDKTKLIVTYVPATERSSYELYNDDGESKNAIAQKAFELIKFISLGKKSNELKLMVRSNKGNFKGKPTARTVRFLIPTIEQQPKQILINNKAVSLPKNASLFDPEKQAFWLKDQNMLNIPLKFIGDDVIVEIRW